MTSTSINSYPYISTTSIESVKTTPVETTPVETTPVETTPVETTPVETTKIINKSTKHQYSIQCLRVLLEFFFVLQYHFFL